jgi:tRNA G46 methylase TrmB
LNLLANCFPKSQFVGIDLSEEAIKFACVEAEQRDNKNVSFIARDLSRFDGQAPTGHF